MYLSFQAYGSNVQKKSQFAELEKQLLKPQVADTGNESESAFLTVMGILKDVHKGRLSAPDPVWHLWASKILEADPELRETMLCDPPPDSVLHLMGKGIQYKTGDINQNSDISSLKKEINGLVETLEHSLSYADVLKARIDGLGIQIKANNNLLQGFNDAVGAELNEMSLQRLVQMPQQADTDH